jgi:prepilin peptidase CpaA
MTSTYAIAIGVAVIGCITDVRTRRIPNVLTFGAALAGLVYHAVWGAGVLSSAEGWLVGAFAFIVPFALGGIGAGDLKLLAALGAWLGPHQAIWLVLYTGVAGGVIAVFVAVIHGYLRQALSNVWLLLAHWTVSGIRPLHEISLEGSQGPRLAYAVPILVGTIMTIWLR